MWKSWGRSVSKLEGCKVRFSETIHTFKTQSLIDLLKSCNLEGAKVGFSETTHSFKIQSFLI
jgi:hypothetical protein